MKKAFFIFMLLGMCSVQAQQMIQCSAKNLCIYIKAPAGGSPAVQVDATDSPGIGVMSQTFNGIASWSGASKPGGTAVWAAAVNGAVALRVQGPMAKEREARNVLKLYDASTGALVGAFEFSIEQLP